MSSKSLSRIGWEALEGFGLGLAVVAFALSVPRLLPREWLNSRWLYLIGSAVFVFGDVAYRLRRSLQKEFVRLSSLALLHIAVGMVIVLRVPAMHPIPSWALVVFITAEASLVRRLLGYNGTGAKAGTG